MSKSENIAYEPHPVSPERKAELRARGLRIIDIQFKPAEPEAESDTPAVEAEATPAPRARKQRPNAA